MDKFQANIEQSKPTLLNFGIQKLKEQNNLLKTMG